ncbi:MAG: serine/threonine protein kinase [Planctomycetaceae bacterium]|nr:serine/threonine protein kinase [Planctomycetaceae bacterium]
MEILKKLFRRNKPADNRIDLKSRFEFVSPMGMGTMSKVWKANDRHGQQVVALKIIDPEKLSKIVAKFPPGTLPQEGEVAVTLDHPHIVKTFEYGMSTDDEPFLVMEYIEGYSLLQFVELQNETMKKYCLKWMIQVGEALEYFHEQNWIHRDLCPKNILTNTSGEIKLIDFGLVVPNTPAFCAPGNRTGTADYMAPELVKRQRTDQRIDVYSYAVTCYQMCVNRLPYPPGKNMQTIIKNLNRAPADIREFVPDLPVEMVQVIMKGLEKRPDDRWQSAAEMTEAFKQFARSR